MIAIAVPAAAPPRIAEEARRPGVWRTEATKAARRAFRTDEKSQSSIKRLISAIAIVDWRPDNCFAVQQLVAEARKSSKSLSQEPGFYVFSSTCRTILRGGSCLFKTGLPRHACRVFGPRKLLIIFLVMTFDPDC